MGSILIFKLSKPFSIRPKCKAIRFEGVSAEVRKNTYYKEYYYKGIHTIFKRFLVPCRSRNESPFLLGRPFSPPFS
jgi:hypothetical protein